MSEKEQDYFTTQELVDMPWFPVKSTITLKTLIEQGEIEAIDVSTNPDRKRYRIAKKSALAFIERRKSKKK